jgi:uncharacterized membrane protein (DUF4010 family)
VIEGDFVCFVEMGFTGYVYDSLLHGGGLLLLSFFGTIYNSVA